MLFFVPSAVLGSISALLGCLPGGAAFPPELKWGSSTRGQESNFSDTIFQPLGSHPARTTAAVDLQDGTIR